MDGRFSRVSVVFAVLACGMLFFARGPLSAQGDSSSGKGGADKRERLETKKDALSRLTEEEKRVHSDLLKAEKRIKSVNKRLSGQVKEYRTVKAELEKRRAELELLVQDQERRQSEMIALLRDLWPVHVRNLALRGKKSAEWGEADREFTWMARVYSEVSDKLAKLRRINRMVLEKLVQAEKAAKEAGQGLVAVNSRKDELLREKLAFSRRLDQVRKKKTDQEEELKSILAEVRKMDYELEKQTVSLKPPKGARLKALKGRLPWPARGRIVSRFNPGAKPPRRGIGMALKPGDQIKAVSRGRVVHNAVMRGFGRVVILLHPGDYYSLYAFLEDCPLEVGKMAEPGELIGKAGFYPRAKGNGLYFELRFHQKAINPEHWLASLK